MTRTAEFTDPLQVTTLSSNLGHHKTATQRGALGVGTFK